jgi:hypothetical protein
MGSGEATTRLRDDRLSRRLPPGLMRSATLRLALDVLPRRPAPG